MTFVIEEEIKLHYSGLYLLFVMNNEATEIELVLPKDQQVLEPILQFLFKKRYVDVKDDRIYQVSDLGRDTLELFLKRYHEFLNTFDIFCAVDLEAGDFALAYYHDYPDPDEWESFLGQDNWSDLRIAVAEAKGLDPVEIVFMSFLNEDLFGRDEQGFQYDLLLGKIWQEIASICTTAIKMKDLGYVDEGIMVSSQDVIAEVIARGEEVKQELGT